MCWKAVPPMTWLQGAEAHDGVHVDVFVQAVDVGEGVVQHVVLDLPHHRVAAHEVEHTPHPKVDPLFVAVGVVVRVVHDVQSDACQAQSHDQFGHPKHPALACQPPGDEGPRHEVQAQSGGRFQVQTPISLAAQVVFLEVGVDAGTKGFGEIRRVSAVSDGRNLHEVKVEPRILRVVHSGHRMPTEFFTSLGSAEGRLGLGDFPNPQRLGRDLEVLVVVDEFHEFLERELLGRGNAQALVRA